MTDVTRSLKPSECGPFRFCDKPEHDWYDPDVAVQR